MVCVTPQKLLRESGKYVVVTDTSLCACVFVYVVRELSVCLSVCSSAHSTSLYEHEVFRNAFQRKNFRTAASFCDKSSTLQNLCQNSC